MTQEIELFLEPDGFYAGKKNKDGKLAKGAHKLTEDEIFTMATTLIRTFAAKTGQDTLVIQGNDGKAVIAKLVEIKGQDAPKEQPAAANSIPKKKRVRRAKKAE